MIYPTTMDSNGDLGRKRPPLEPNPYAIHLFLLTYTSEDGGFI